MILAVIAALAIAAVASWREFSDDGVDWGGHGGAGRPRFGRIVRFVVMVVFAVAVGIGIGPVIRGFSELDIAGSLREAIYTNTIGMIEDFPLTGTGKGTYVSVYDLYEKIDDKVRVSFAHNDYLEFMAENGLIGGGAIILAGVGLFFWLASMWRRRRDAFAKGIGLGALLGVLALLLHGFTDFNLQITSNAVYFTTLLMLGVAVLADRRERGRPSASWRRRAEEEWGHAPAERVSAPSRIRSLRLIGAALLAVLVFVPAVRDYLGFWRLGDYRRVRSNARSVESAFPDLEARLEKAADTSPLAVFQVEMARLYMEMARVANEAGRDEDRDAFCDRAVARYSQAIAANPIAAGTHYEMAGAYLLYNFPLMTYQDSARTYLRKTLELKPADEEINLTVVFLYATWWPTLEPAEKAYAAEIYKKHLVRDPDFPAKLEGRWAQSHGSADGLRPVLEELAR
jgi:hypothetical protein